MKRRSFLKTAGAAAGAVVFFPGKVIQPDRLAGAPPGATDTEPFLELRGSPARKSCDGFADYNEVSFEEMCEDMVHHRMPEEWQTRLLFGAA